MSDWKPLDVSEDELEGIDASDFSATPEQLHTEFQTSATHLHEVQSMHKHVLVQAGMIPETHIAEVEPTQRLEWVLEELHGMSNPDGLTVPLLGVAPEELEVQIKEVVNLICNAFNYHQINWEKEKPMGQLRRPTSKKLINTIFPNFIFIPHPASKSFDAMQ